MIRRGSAGWLGISVTSLLLVGCNLSIGNSSDNKATTSGTQIGSNGTGPAQYSIGGTTSGLVQSGLVLASASNSTTVAAGATAFTLPALVGAGATYSVSIKAQPSGQTCTVRNGSGTVTSVSVTTVQVSCVVDTYAIGGTITGLNASGLALVNGTDTLTVATGASAYMMPVKRAMGVTYDVTIQAQPLGLACQVVNGSGTMPAASVSDVDIVCGEWTWVNGANTTGSAGSYGMQGVAASSNAPSARSGAVRWMDHGGRLWLFGGAAGGGSLSDLWRFDPGSSQWTWIAGVSSSNATGQYGTQGTEAVGNAPGARQNATGWVDATGNLWMFGGQGYAAAGSSGSLDDLWEYDLGSGLWKWVGGESTAYASGATLPTGEPGARSGASGWVDANGHLWLFGGTGTTGATNDLWQYIAGGSGWSLVSGSQTPAMNGVYGTQGTAASTNLPGSRTQASAFTDGAGNLWLFGGQGLGSIGGIGLLNDLWMFSPSSGQWTWMGGWKTVNAAGIYGTKSTTAVNLPGARYAAGVAADANGNLWLFGGTGYDVDGAQGALGDLWQYAVSSNQWFWMGGSQTRASLGSYGSQGVGAPSNAPGARTNGAAWVDSSGNFWLFGGAGSAGATTAGPLSDLWQFIP